jgi:uncharacterized lipoprotein YddW (UPF0748 family)
MWIETRPARPEPTALARAARRLAPSAALLMIAAAAPCAGAGSIPAPESNRPAPAAPESLASTFEYLWVVRTSLLTHDDVVRTVARAREMGVRGLLVQVVGRGDAYYRSDLLPRADAIREPGLDPLGLLLPLAHDAGLEVHAWMNCMLVWSGPRPPRDPRHVVNAHPEWIARLHGGRRMSSLSARERRRLGVEGVFLSPGHPGVRTWVANVAREIVTRYPVDGIHLDYIRQPSADVGYDPTTRARFALVSGVDPERIGRLPAPERDSARAEWADFLRDQVTATVAEVRDTLERVRPGLPLSAAVLADTSAAERRNAQTWGRWLRDGLIDRAYVMCYSPIVQTVMDQLLSYAERLGVSDRVVPGIAVYNSPPSSSAAKIRGARSLGYPVLALYSYDALQDTPGYWPVLKDLLRPRPRNN